MYEITLLFSELLSPVKGNDLAYNLGFGPPPEEFKERSFNVSINNNEVLSGLNNAEYLQPNVRLLQTRGYCHKQ